MIGFIHVIFTNNFGPFNVENCKQVGMVEFIGLLKVKVIKGTNLAIRDMMSSDPYVVLNLGQQVSVSLSLVYYP